MTGNNIILTDPEDFQRQHTLLYNLMHMVNVWMARLSKRPVPEPRRAVPVIILLVPSSVLTALGLILLLIFRYDPPQSAGLYVYLGAALFMVVWAAEMGMRQTTLTLAQTEVEVFNSEKERAYLSRDIPFQGIPGLFLAVVSLPIAWLVYPLLFQAQLAWPAYLFTFVTAAFWGEGVYIATSTSLRFIKVVLSQDLPIYVINPQQSVFVKRVSNLYEVVLWTTSASVVVLLSPWLFLERTFWVDLMALTVAAGGLFILVVQFINGQVQLRKIVNKKKQTVMFTLQSQVNEIYDTGQYTVEDTFSELQNLIKLHDQVATTRNWGFSTTGTIRSLASFIPPLSAIIFAQNERFITIANQLATLLLQT